AYGIDGYLNGSFPVPFGELSLGNWDVIVTAHEMGHNFGTFHTHDGYFPTIDDCGNGVPSRGTIMSYCHIHAGYSMNIDMRFHALVQEVMQLDVAPGSCHGWDCNGNGVDDAEDIASTASPDVNLNGIPDECEDCNSNGTLDPQDIAMGAPDVNGNGVPDECEPDCNSNSSPDDWDIFITASDDDNGNNIPDECEPDCNGNSTPDFVEAALGTADDFNRNTIPDECEDCNVNGVPDWLDMERQHNIYIADRSGWVQELSWEAGYPIKQFGGPPTMNDPQGVAFGPDRQLYVANTGANNILRVDVDNDVITTFVATGSGGLSQPTALVFGSGGRLYVASSGTDEILLYNGTTGASMGAFVSAGSGGLDEPLGLEFGPRGNLFVSSGLTNQVIEYNGATGALVGDFADNTGGELATPRGLACHPNGNLLVASYLTSQVLEYDGTTGAFVGVFNDDVTPTGVWGLRAGPNGNIYAMRSAGTIRLLELLPIGRYYRARVRGNNANIPSPTGVAFRPASQFDCNGNLVLDTCDITSGTSFDVNANGIPDECESIACTCPNQGDVAPLATTGDGSIDILDVVAKIDYVFRSGPALTHDGTCPGERADWNCDGIVDVLDVVGSVDFVFRSSGIGPCQPCDCFIYPGDCPPWP
ncbi:MAG: hypothetical protein ACE5F8_07115, partial [Woeseiaceae bacterium]